MAKSFLQNTTHTAELYMGSYDIWKEIPCIHGSFAPNLAFQCEGLRGCGSKVHDMVLATFNKAISVTFRYSNHLKNLIGEFSE